MEFAPYAPLLGSCDARTVRHGLAGHKQLLKLIYDNGRELALQSLSPTTYNSRRKEISLRKNKVSALIAYSKYVKTSLLTVTMVLFAINLICPQCLHL